jgi:hypothetical protein
MAHYEKEVAMGKWARASELGKVARAIIVSETKPMESKFENEDGSKRVQDVCKVRFEGMQEPLNVSLNRATLNGLIDAFGNDSTKWLNKVLSVETEKVRVAGKSVTALYLIPDGFERVDDAAGYAMIVRKGADAPEEIPQEEVPETDVPF